MLVLFALLLALLLAASTFAFERRPQLVDSVVQLFQAEIFASGSLTAPAPAPPEFFVTQHMVIADGRWYSQYPPGHAALLALGVLAGAPWLVPIFLSLATAALLFGFVRRAYDEATARLTLLLLVFAPFFWFMGASFMSHVSSLAGVSGMLYGLARWERGGRLRVLVASGASLGLAFLSRPVEALALALVFGGVLAIDAVRRRDVPPIAAWGVAFALVASAYLAYNAATTGSAFRPGYIELWGESHGLGFHESPWGERHTPADGLRNGALDLALLSVFLFEWPVPALWPLGIGLVAGWLTTRWDLRLLAGSLAVPLANVFYWHRDTFLGPRFLHVTLAFVVPLTARAVIEGARRLRGRPAWIRRTAGFALLLAAGYAVAYGIPARFLIYRTSMASMKLDLDAAARAAGIERGVVFVAESWGSRVIAELRGLGVGAAGVEKAYRRADLCELDGIVRRARTEGWDPARVRSAVAAAIVAPEALALVEVAGDPTVRLRPGSRLSPACLDEIRYDEAAAYSLFTPQLPANEPGLDGPRIFARDLRARNVELLARAPDRSAWIYRGGALRPWSRP